MYLSHLDAHARSIEELTGTRPYLGRSMYIENQRHRTGIIDDTQLNKRRHQHPLAQRPVTIHWGALSTDIMSGNYVSGWQQPRDNQAVGQQVIHSAGMKLQHQQSHPQRQQGRRPFGRYGSRPSTDSTELIGGQTFKPGGNRAADMFKRAKDHTDKYAIDDDAITPQSVQKAREGVDDYDLPVPTRRSQSKPAARPAARPVSQPARPAQTSTPTSSYATQYGAPQTQQQQPAQAQRQAQHQQQAQRQQQATRQPAQPQSPYATDFGKPVQTRPVNPPSTKGPQYDARARQQRNHQEPVASCNWNKDSASKRFHAGVQPYEDSYNRSAQGWSSTYKDTFSDDDGSYDPFAPKASPNYKTAPKLNLSRQSSRQGTSYGDFNKSAQGWNPIGLGEDDADVLFNPNRPGISTLSTAFEEPRPRYGGTQQRAAQPSRPAQQQQQQQQRRVPPSQHRPPQQRMSATAPYAAGAGGWGGMLESDDL